MYSEELHEKVLKCLDEHEDFSKQLLGTQKDAYVFHLVKLIKSNLEKTITREEFSQLTKVLQETENDWHSQKQDKYDLRGQQICAILNKMNIKVEE